MDNSFYDLLVNSGFYSSNKCLKNYIFSTTGNLDFYDKEVLDVGGGNGILSLWACYNGASVICLEPEFEGSTNGVVNKLESFYRENITFLTANGGTIKVVMKTIQEYVPNIDFDIIIMANTINHLNEDCVVDLLNNNECRAVYSEIFQKLKELLKDKGILIVSDCSKSNFFGDLGIRNPFMPSIEWFKHQDISFWVPFFKKLNFILLSSRFSTFNSLGVVGRVLCNNRFISYLTLSHFVLHFRNHKT